MKIHHSASEIYSFLKSATKGRFLTPDRIAVPRRPVSLGGELWGITTYFNPVGYLNKLEHLKLFCDGVRAQGLKLLIVEAAFNQDPFVLDQSLANMIIRVRPQDILWQKERLLNIALDNLPPTCDKVVWLDADIFLENSDWVHETSRLLEEFVAVQPYDVAWWLPNGVQSPPPDCSGDGFVNIADGLSYVHARSPDRYSSGYVGHPGFAWAIRRDVLRKHHFYDRLILGGADLVMCWGMYDHLLRMSMQWWLGNCSQSQIRDLSTWKERFHADVQGSVFFVGGRAFHMWHGTLENRRYHERQLHLQEADFDPQGDIALDGELCWRWHSHKPDLHRRASDYFRQRQEGPVSQKSLV
jgi:hypothetical protein